MGVYAFNPAAFRAIYPAFSTVADAALADCFARATLVLDNTEASPVQDVAQRGVLLNLLVAHMAALSYGEHGQAPSGLVGRVNSATQGSVTVSTDYGALATNQAWFVQTQYGAQYWQLTAPYRGLRWVGRPGNAQLYPVRWY